MHAYLIYQQTVNDSSGVNCDVSVRKGVSVYNYMNVHDFK